jgi:hypothetical protein
MKGIAAIIAGIAALTGPAAGAAGLGEARTANFLQRAANNTCPGITPPACQGTLTQLYGLDGCITGYSCASAANDTGEGCTLGKAAYSSGQSLPLQSYCALRNGCPEMRGPVGLIRPMAMVCQNGRWEPVYPKEFHVR